MSDIHLISFAYLLFVNICAVVLYGWDKFCARQGWRRTPEKVLLLLALFGGTIGAMAAMAIFRHKTRHLKFRYGVPVIFILQIAGLVLLHIDSAFP